LNFFKENYEVQIGDQKSGGHFMAQNEGPLQQLQHRQSLQSNRHEHSARQRCAGSKRSVLARAMIRVVVADGLPDDALYSVLVA
jgi:hypothetical protein